MLYTTCFRSTLIALYCAFSFSIACSPLASNFIGPSKITKRWFARVGQTWPSSTIQFCFADDQSYNELRAIVYDGWRLWQRFQAQQRFQELANCGNKPEDVLTISYNNKGIIRTTVAKSPLPNPPAMTFDPNAPVLQNDDELRMAAMAHEIGHAWGLLHEHQRPTAWDSQVAGEPGEIPDPIGPNTLVNVNWRNLADYDDFRNWRQGMYDFSDLTRSWGLAVSAGFSGADFLPIPRLPAFLEDTGPMDWTSIMIYSNVAGAKYPNPQTTLYRTNNGPDMLFVTAPSNRDIARLNAMYPTNEPPQDLFLPYALRPISNPRASKWKKLVGQAYC